MWVPFAYETLKQESRPSVEDKSILSKATLMKRRSIRLFCRAIDPALK